MTDPITAMDAERLREEARNAPTLVAMLRALMARNPYGLGRGLMADMLACVYCNAPEWVAMSHCAGCPWAAAEALLAEIDGQ